MKATEQDARPVVGLRGPADWDADVAGRGGGGAAGPGNRAYYDDFSSGYEAARGHGYHAMLDDLEASVVASLSAGRTVLEVGCGTGLILSRLVPTAAAVTGVDLSRGMIRRARDRGLDVVQGSATALPFADESFDVVCSFKVLAHVSDIERAMGELWRVTRPGGHVLAEFYNAWSLRYLAKRLAGPQAIARNRTEADIFTRWDTPLSIKRYFPRGAEFVGWRGVRVVTPAAFVHNVPYLGRWLPTVERLALTSPARYVGGFLIAVLRKEGRR